MARGTMTSDEVLDQLRLTPVRLTALTRGVPARLLRTPPDGDEWSPNDVLAHLRACSDRWGEAATRIVREDGPTIQGINPRHWIKRTDYPTLAFSTSLRAFVRQRAALLDVLEPLSAAQWQRTGTTVGAGAPLTHSVYFYAEQLARHERTHLKQLAKMVTALAS